MRHRFAPYRAMLWQQYGLRITDLHDLTVDEIQTLESVLDEVVNRGE